VVISQPMYFPWPGFFELIALADVLIWLDDARHSNSGSFTSRVQVRLDGGRKWMTIPLERRATQPRLADLEPASPQWIASHREMLRQSLGHAPHLDMALSDFERATARFPLVECLIASSEVPAGELGVLPREILRSSRMGIGGGSWQRILDLTKATGAGRYVTAHGSANYLDHEAFERQGVSVDYVDYSLTPWPQEHGAFTPYVTVLDLIAATGDEARHHLHPRTKPWREHLQMMGLHP
jgi:hypothetical protein